MYGPEWTTMDLGVVQGCPFGSTQILVSLILRNHLLALPILLDHWHGQYPNLPRHERNAQVDQLNP